MTENIAGTCLLIAFSKAFAFRRLFEKKIAKLLINFIPDQIELCQDDLLIATHFFAEKNIATKTATLGHARSALKKSLEKYTHILVFWDGEDLTDIVYFAKLLHKNLRIVPVQLTTIKNKDKGEKYDVYIGRGTPWGNPFPIGYGEGGDSREVVIEKYRRYFEDELLKDPARLQALLSLRGYRLGCHCKPLACHGDIIAAYLNSVEDEAGLSG